MINQTLQAEDNGSKRKAIRYKAHVEKKDGMMEATSTKPYPGQTTYKENWISLSLTWKL